jgi:uncharacterized membrane protein YeiH
VAFPAAIDLVATVLFSITGAMVAIPWLVSALCAIAITFVIRMLAISFDWRTKSVRPPPPSN